MKEGWFKIIRPKQWIKNVFVFSPMIFGGELLNLSAIISSIIVFFAFCFMASSIYCFNDIMDQEEDSRHQTKRFRPLALGIITVKQALIVMIIALFLGLAVTLLLGKLDIILRVDTILIAYYIMNLFYCAYLKHYAIIDVCVVALGFVLRVFAGGEAINIMPSSWLVLMTFLLTLFLSFSKRRDDVIKMMETGEAPRKNTIRYNLTFINQAITITASITLVCYIMYTVSLDVISRFHTDKLYFTSIFVLLGLLRYIQLTVVDKRSGDPTLLMLKDRFIQVVIFLWALTFLLLIYVA